MKHININDQHKESLTRQERLALKVTNAVGTMYCVYLFAFIGVGSLVGIITQNAFLGAVCGATSSYFLQLVMLPLLQLGQNLQQRHQEMLAEKDYYIDIETEKSLNGLHEKLDKLLEGK